MTIMHQTAQLNVINVHLGPVSGSQRSADELCKQFGPRSGAILFDTGGTN